jgi:hypothetical protein
MLETDNCISHDAVFVSSLSELNNLFSAFKFHQQNIFWLRSIYVRAPSLPPPPRNTPTTISLIIQELVNQGRVSSLDSYGDTGDSSALVNGTSPKIRNEISKRDVDITIFKNNLLLTNRHSYLYSQVVA